MAGRIIRFSLRRNKRLIGLKKIKKNLYGYYRLRVASVSHQRALSAFPEKMKLFVLMAYPVNMAEGAGLGRVWAVMNPAVFRPGKLSFASTAADRNLTYVWHFSLPFLYSVPSTVGDEWELCSGLLWQGRPTKSRRANTIIYWYTLLLKGQGFSKFFQCLKAAFIWSKYNKTVILWNINTI